MRSTWRSTRVIVSAIAAVVVGALVAGVLTGPPPTARAATQTCSSGTATGIGYDYQAPCDGGDGGGGNGGYSYGSYASAVGTGAAGGGGLPEHPLAWALLGLSGALATAVVAARRVASNQLAPAG